MFQEKELLPFDCPECARPMMEEAQREAEVWLAASQLRKLRQAAGNRPPRIYTGRVGRKRAWRGMQIVLPDGKIGSLIMALRGIAVVSWVDPFAVQPNRIGYFRVTDLARFKIPAAVILGGRKRGVRERPSAKKAVAVRANGSAPPRPGSRPRGRPRTMKRSESTPCSIE